AVLTGRHSNNLFVLDCDSPENFNRIRQALSDRNLNGWVRNSARGGQFWFRSVQGEVANIHCAYMQVLGNRMYSVAPPSMHPSGMLYEWVQREGELPPVVTIDQIDFLPTQLTARSRQ